MEDPHTHAFTVRAFCCRLALLRLGERDYRAGPLRQLCFQQPLDSYQGRECEIISHRGDCPLALSHAPLQHLISTLLMPCATTEILYRRGGMDGERIESLEATACSHFPTLSHSTKERLIINPELKNKAHEVKRWKGNGAFYQNILTILPSTNASILCMK